MERRNVMLDDEAWEAASYLAGVYSHNSVSAAIRHAVKRQARRKGWKPEPRRPSAGGPSEGADRDRGR
jgi:sulfur relay (sulfurtransferase) DsrC/TusE family protein